MPKWRNSFPVRTSRRMHEFRGQVCPECGQADPLLLTKDGRCANCAAHGKAEKHHIVGGAFRKTEEARQAVIPVSPNAHRLLSDLQAEHAKPPLASVDSPAFLEAFWCEVGLSLYELWLVFGYLGECPEYARDLLKVFAVGFVILLVMNISAMNVERIVDRARRQLYEKVI